MNPFMRRRFILGHVLAFVVAAIFGATSSRSEANCIGSWSKAAPIVEANGLMPVEALTKEAPTRLNGSIVKATLCEEDGRYIYSLVLREDGGKLRQRKVDAKQPF